MSLGFSENRYDHGRYSDVRSRYGNVASWAVWAPRVDKHKSGIDDLSIFDPDHKSDILGTIHTKQILVALNFSRTPETADWANFHSSNPHGTDFKLRHALSGTPLWGAYMTDLIKNHIELKASEVRRKIRADPQILSLNIDSLRREIEAVASDKPELVAIGKDSYELLVSGLADDFSITQIPHYAQRSSQDEYREDVCGALG